MVEAPEPVAPPAPVEPPKPPEPIMPAGPMLEKPKPAKLSGPRIVRVEAPEPERPMRGKPAADEPAAVGAGRRQQSLAF